MYGQEISLITAVLRIIVAGALGSVIGYQRELRDRPAGLRTHALVSTAAALYTVLSLYAFPAASADVSRIAANVAVGIGFIGAGTIIRQGSLVVGLTTAASLWTVAAIGISCASGHIALGVVVSFLVLLILAGMKHLELKIGEKRKFTVELATKDKINPEKELLKYADLESVVEKKEDAGYSYTITFYLLGDSTIDEARGKLSSLGEVVSVEWGP